MTRTPHSIRQVNIMVIAIVYLCCLLTAEACYAQVIRHEIYDCKADVFSWGVLLVELLSARPPYGDQYLTPVQVREWAIARQAHTDVHAAFVSTRLRLRTAGGAKAVSAHNQVLLQHRATAGACNTSAALWLPCFTMSPARHIVQRTN